MWWHERNCRFFCFTQNVACFIKCNSLPLVLHVSSNAIPSLKRLALQKVEDPFDVIEEDPSMRRAPAARRVDGMIDKMQKKLPGQPKFLLCVLAERKNSDIYGQLH